MRGQTPLPTRARDALSALNAAIEANHTGLSHAEARDVLRDAGFEQADVADLLEILLLRGYIYEVDEHVFVT